MKKAFNFISLFILTSSAMYAQSPKDSFPARVSEQKEIKATDHLKKELEQKQLTALPERIGDSTINLSTSDKRKNKKCKHPTLNQGKLRN